MSFSLNIVKCEILIIYSVLTLCGAVSESFMWSKWALYHQYTSLVNNIFYVLLRNKVITPIKIIRGDLERWCLFEIPVIGETEAEGPLELEASLGNIVRSWSHEIYEILLHIFQNIRSIFPSILCVSVTIHADEKYFLESKWCIFDAICCQYSETCFLSVGSALF